MRLPAAQRRRLLPRGLGYGPAEINLSPSSDYQLGNQLLTDRYPASGVPLDRRRRRPPCEPQQVVSLRRHLLDSAISSLDFNAAEQLRAHYGSPPDVAGIGRDRHRLGRPAALCFMGQNLGDSTHHRINALTNSNLSAKWQSWVDTTPGNVPFSAAELERLLRPYDQDATSLPGRLAAMATRLAERFNGISATAQPRVT